MKLLNGKASETAYAHRPNIDDLMLHHLMCILRCGGHSVTLVLKAYVNEFHIEERLQVSS